MHIISGYQVPNRSLCPEPGNLPENDGVVPRPAPSCPVDPLVWRRDVHLPSQSMQVAGIPSNGEFEMTAVGLGDEDARGAGENGSGDVTAAERAERYPAGNSSAAGAVANFVNTIVGAGIVGLPFALAQVCARLPFFVQSPFLLKLVTEHSPPSARFHVLHPNLQISERHFLCGRKLAHGKDSLARPLVLSWRGLPVRPISTANWYFCIFGHRISVLRWGGRDRVLKRDFKQQQTRRHAFSSNVCCSLL